MGGLRKYRGLMVAISLFLLVIAVVSVVNLYIARDLDQDAISVNLSGRQRMLSQRTAKAILAIQREHERGGSTEKDRQELALAVRLFDATLEGFKFGGAVTGGDGKPTALRRAEVGGAQLEAATEIWIPYKNLLERLISFEVESTAKPEPGSADVTALADYALVHNTRLLNLMNEFTTALERQSKQRAATLRWIQIAALSTALALFAYIVLVSLRSLRNADAAVVAAKKETDDILATVNDGLFLIDKDLVIGKQQSMSLSRIFGTEGLAGKKLLDVLSKLVPERTVQTAQSFLELLFGERVKEALMGDVNPLRQVQVSSVNAQGQQDTRYLSFQFKRVLTDEKLSHLLVSAADVTAEVELKAELDRTRKRNEEQVGLLTKMMHLGSTELGAFMDKMQKGLDEMNEVLSRGGTSKSENMSKLGQLFRIIHTLKGDAAALDFDPIESWAHRVEDDIHSLRKQPEISGNDLLPLTVAMREMYQQLAGIRELIGKLGSVRSTFESVDAQRPQPSVWAKAQMLVEKVAQRSGKLVKLQVQRETGVQIHRSQFHDVSDALVQLVRNAIVHGIETPEQRLAAGKDKEGHVQIRIAHGPNGTYEINVEDDGAGINIEAIRSQAVRSGLLAEDEAQAATQAQLVRMMFESGFSTADYVTEDAGRGVGLDVIEQAVKRMGGSLGIGSKAGRGARFSIVLPAEAQNDERAA